MPTHIKQFVIDHVVSSKEWRHYLSERDPDNKRNFDAVAALADLANYVGTLPDHHELFAMLSRVTINDLDTLFFKKDTIRNWWYERLSIYGYDREENHAAFIREAVAVLAEPVS